MKQASRGGLPERILLATDLTAACDRAFGRAVQLARMWRAHLTVVHVVETGEREVIGVSQRTADASAEIELLIGPYRDQLDFQISQHLSFGNAVEALLVQARETECDFLITGLAYTKSLSATFIGSTVEQLVREAQVPVLAVRRRAYRPYQSIAVGVDFSEPSQHALNHALALYPDAKFAAVHAYNIGFAGNVSTDAMIVQYEKKEQTNVQAVVQAAMSTCLTKSGQEHSKIKTHYSHGDPEVVMKTFIEHDESDLAVVGTHGRAGLQRALIGSVAARLLNTLPCDVLAIHPNARSPRNRQQYHKATTVGDTWASTS